MKITFKNCGRQFLLQVLIFQFVLGPGYLFAQTPDQEQLAVPAPAQEYNLRHNGISVHVFGSVNRPGTYSLWPTERVVSAIRIAGDIKSTGSEKKIELRRSRSPTKIIDLIELRRTGHLKNNPFLQDDDVIFVPMKGPSAAIQGAVKEPGTYELGENPTLASLIMMAADFSTGLANNYPIEVVRFNDLNEREIIRVENQQDKLTNFMVKDGDIIQVPHLFTMDRSFDQSIVRLPNETLTFGSYIQDIFVVGGVKVPGKYPFTPLLRANNYIALAGGLARLGRKDIIIRRLSGQEFKTTSDTKIPLNPGDTVIVGENKLGPDFWITFMTTVVSLGLSSYAILRTR